MRHLVCSHDFLIGYEHSAAETMVHHREAGRPGCYCLKKRYCGCSMRKEAGRNPDQQGCYVCLCPRGLSTQRALVGDREKTSRERFGRNRGARVLKEGVVRVRLGTYVRFQLQVYRDGRSSPLVLLDKASAREKRLV